MRRYKHILIPIGLALMALGTRYLFLHDTGTVRGAFILGADGLKWLVAVPGHAARPYPPDPFLSLPLDAIALGVVMAGITSIYLDCLQLRWKHRERPPSLPPIQEL